MIDQSLIIHIQKATGLSVHHLVMPEGQTLPAIVYRRVNNSVRISHDGRAMDRSTIILSVWATTYAGVFAVLDTITQSLRHWSHKGQIVRQETSGIEYEPEVNFFRGTINFQIFFGEA